MLDYYYASFPGASRLLPSELGLFVMAAIVVGIAFTLASGRSVDDPSQARSVARYLGAITILTLFVTLFAAFGAVNALSDLLVNHRDRARDLESQAQAALEDDFVSYSSLGEGSSLPLADGIFDFSTERNNDANFAFAVASGLVALTTGAVLVVHLRWRRRLGEHDDTAPVTDAVFRTVSLTVCFVTALVAAIALTSLGFAVFEIVAPGVAIGGKSSVVRAEGISEAISFGLLLVAAIVLFVVAWRRARPAALARRSEPSPTSDDGSPPSQLSAPATGPATT